MIDLQEKPSTETVRARRWTNKWRALQDVECLIACNASTPKGGVYVECRCAPRFTTKAAAEAEAMRDLMEQIAHYGELLNEWLGAVPLD